MPIQSQHPEYERVYPLIKRTFDAFEGDVLEYVPRKESQTVQQYEKFRGRPSFYNVTERTTIALVGALTRKAARVDNIDVDSINFSQLDSMEDFLQHGYTDLLITGKVGMLVDFDDATNQPYITSYSGMNIINWNSDFVVLQEQYFGSDPNDRYKTITLTRFRELFIDDDGFYAVRIWEQVGRDSFEVAEVIEPLVRGQRLDFIPFVCVNPYDTTMATVNPPLSTLANINIEHFILQAGLAHVAWVLASPTPVIVGDLQDETNTIGLGGDKFIHLRQGGSATYMEFSGSGTDFLLDMTKNKEEQMFSFGSRLLQYKNGVESGEALQIRLGAEGASLVTFANALEEGLKKVLRMYNFWITPVETEIDVELNRDFSPSSINSDSVRLLLELFSKNVISMETLMKRLYEGEIIDDVEDELMEMQQSQETQQPVVDLNTNNDEGTSI